MTLVVGMALRDVAFLAADEKFSLADAGGYAGDLPPVPKIARLRDGWVGVAGDLALGLSTLELVAGEAWGEVPGVWAYLTKTAEPRLEAWRRQSGRELEPQMMAVADGPDGFGLALYGTDPEAEPPPGNLQVVAPPDVEDEALGAAFRELQAACSRGHPVYGKLRALARFFRDVYPLSPFIGGRIDCGVLLREGGEVRHGHLLVEPDEAAGASDGQLREALDFEAPADYGRPSEHGFRWPEKVPQNAPGGRR